MGKACQVSEVSIHLSFILASYINFDNWLCVKAICGAQVAKEWLVSLTLMNSQPGAIVIKHARWDVGLWTIIFFFLLAKRNTSCCLGKGRWLKVPRQWWLESWILSYRGVLARFKRKHKEARRGKGAFPPIFFPLSFLPFQK
jgi:hypothetical protein